MKFYHAKIWSACAVELINTGSVMRGEWSPFAVFRKWRCINETQDTKSN